MIDQSVRYLKGVGPALEEVLSRLGIHTVRDLLCYFPVRYEDRSRMEKISGLKEDTPALVCVSVKARALRKPRKSYSFFKGSSIFEAIVADDSGTIHCVWFNQPYLANMIKVGDTLLLYGKVTRYKGRRQFTSPEYEKIDSSDSPSFNVGRIVGFYRLTQGISQKRLRKLIDNALRTCASDVEDPLPFSLRKDRHLTNISRSMHALHQPENMDEAEHARRRFIYEELFFSQLLVHIRKAKRVRQQGVCFSLDEGFMGSLRRRIGFSLTKAQERTLSAVFADMSNTHPMHRLIQGDVGSGKTVIALCAAAVCARAGYQACLMVPTEVLALQHYHTLCRLLEKEGFGIDLLVSGLSRKQKEEKLQGFEQGTTAIAVGTHALIEEDVRFKRLGLVIIDEEHKFGVAQRELLPRKGTNPDYIVMSATPIPRSLALTLYGDLDISVIDELPPGRKQPLTAIVEERKREWVYEFIEKKLDEGRQAYLIFPVIEESIDEDLHSVNEMYHELTQRFRRFSVGVVHGRLKKEEKEKVMQRFRDGRVHLLLSTTVIEVGVNIENATVMVVENPERFGLAQLHQLRGRIRRSVHEPHFILMARAGLGAAARERLAILRRVSDGFVIAEEDLKMRGPGDFFGRCQWGYPLLKKADPLQDIELLDLAGSDAAKVIAGDPALADPEHRCIRAHLRI